MLSKCTGLTLLYTCLLLASCADRETNSKDEAKTKPNHSDVRSHKKPDEQDATKAPTDTASKAINVIFTLFPNKTTQNTTADFGFSTSSTSAKFLCKLDEQTPEACRSPKHLQGLSDGEHHFAVFVQGDTSKPRAEYVWTIDTQAPTVALTATPAAVEQTTTATFEISSSEDNVLFQCSLDGKKLKDCENPLVFPDLPSGLHTLVISAKDTAGNLSENLSYEWTIDTIPPETPEIVEPAGYLIENEAEPILLACPDASCSAFCLTQTATPPASDDACWEPLDSEDELAIAVSWPRTATTQWCAHAKDEAGNISTAACKSFRYAPQGLDWEVVNKELPFAPRTDQRFSVFNDRMWVIGGDLSFNELKNDVWSSQDGVTWEEATDDAGFSPRMGHCSVVLKDKLFVLGGFQVYEETPPIPGTTIADVWNTSNGKTWERTAFENLFTERFGHGCAVMNDAIWVSGGKETTRTSRSYKNDVWTSTDGKNWSLVTANADFSARFLHSMVAFKNRLWLIGGHNGNVTKDKPLVYHNDVWSSANGRDWVLEVNEAPFHKLTDRSLIVHDNRLWLLGGNKVNNGDPYDPKAYDIYVNEIWYSEDGKQWAAVSLEPPFEQIYAGSTVVFKDALWVLGEPQSGALNPLWKSATWGK